MDYTFYETGDILLRGGRPPDLLEVYNGKRRQWLPYMRRAHEIEDLKTITPDRAVADIVAYGSVTRMDAFRLLQE